MSTDDSAPATKGDVKASATALRADMVAMKDEILRHFDVVVENIRHDLEGANRDEIEVMKDQIGENRGRIQVLEARPV